MLDDIGILVTSHISFTAARERLLISIQQHAHEVPLLIVVGGAHNNETENATCWVAQHNSFEYTSLIEFIQRRPIFPDHILCLQDTMEIGPNTLSLVKQTNPDVWATAAFGGQCNLVTYRYDYLLARSNDILAMKNCTKKKSVEQEGMLWKTAEKCARYTHDRCEENWDIYYPYGTDTPRIKEYYEALDIIKWKANHARCFGMFVTTL